MPITQLNVERRRHSRTRVQMAVDCVRLDPDGGNVMDSIHIVDVSQGGMGAVSDRAFYPGQRVLLHLPSTQDGGQRNIHATVVRCRHRNEGFRIGMQFDASVAATWADRATMAIAA